MTQEYTPPVSHLLELGYAWKDRPDYLQEFGFTVADIPELERLLFDESLYYVDGDDPHGWGHLHAMYALGELRDIEALKILIKAAVTLTENQALWDVIPEAMGKIGEAGIPYFTETFRIFRKSFMEASTLTEAIAKAGEYYPELRDTSIKALTDFLAEHPQNSKDVNANLIINLLDLKAIESALVMERAIQAGHVDEMLTGDWESIQVDLGLKEPDPNRDEFASFQRYLDRLMPPLSDFDEPPHKDRTLARAPKQDANKARKKKLKAEKQARKKNRKKK